MSTIKKLRVLLGLSQSQFAKKLGIATSTISSYEIEHRIPKLEFAMKLIILAKKNHIKLTLDAIYRPEECECLFTKCK